MKKVKQWTIAGVIVLILLGSLLHFVYAWTGHSKIIGLFVPVNESVWEHLKMGYWALALFSLAEYPNIKQLVHQYFVAKLAGVLALEATILAIFYGHLLITGKDDLLVDILSYIAGALACQYLTYRIFRLKPTGGIHNKTGLAVFAAIGVLFGVLTYYPPHTALFRDGNDQTYGIKKGA